MSFTQAVINQEARTENGMKARASTADSCVDLFFKIGASRGQNIIPSFVSAFVQNEDLATRILLWTRDVREGAGERKIFRDILEYLCINKPDLASAIVKKIPELGRWDDMFSTNGIVRTFAFNLIKDAIKENNGLCAKWMPRKGEIASELRKFLGLSFREYRKTLVGLTDVVEQQMCAKQWSFIDFNKVPSVAGSRYKKAFSKNAAQNYGAWATALVSDVPEVKAYVKVNAGAVYPYDVIKGLISLFGFKFDKANLNNIVAQWEALPNYMGDSSVLPMVDVSSSMTCSVGGTTTAMDVAVSLGLYCADKNKGPFKDTFLTFSGNPELLNLQGNIVQKIEQMIKSKWAMNTNLNAAFDKILSVATKGKVSQEEMPKILLVLSDMQFDSCVSFDDSAIEMIRRKYEKAGYEIPQVVFWNLSSADNVPVKFNEKSVALVSGFSPSIMKAVLAADMDEFSPQGIMMKTIMKSRYDY